MLAGDWTVPLHWVSGKGFSEAGANHRKILWKSIPDRAFEPLPNITPTTFSFHSTLPSGALLISRIQPLLVSNMPCYLLFPCLHVLLFSLSEMASACPSAKLIHNSGLSKLCEGRHFVFPRPEAVPADTLLALKEPLLIFSDAPLYTYHLY